MKTLTGVLGALAAGAVLVLLVSGATWQTLRAVRLRPLADEVVTVSGRSLEPALPAVALAVLAGAVAVLATRGMARRLVGALLVIGGLAVVWRASIGLVAASADRARTLVADRTSGVGLATVQRVAVTVHPVWPVLAIVGGVVIAGAGGAVAWRGGEWRRLSGRYDRPAAVPADGSAERDLTLWTALDRGDDPTSRTES